MITVEIITPEKKADINIPNEAFPLFGRMIPSYVNGKWDYEIQYFPEEEVTDMCFPDENYDFESMKEEHIFVGAYEDGKCIGLAILKHYFLKYLYLYDLKVNSDYRGKGVGKKLIEKAKELATANGYRGVYTIGQDNNLAACRFYIKAGFVIGGLDTNVYKGTSQEGKADIIFYLDA